MKNQPLLFAKIVDRRTVTLKAGVSVTDEAGQDRPTSLHVHEVQKGSWCARENDTVRGMVLEDPAGRSRDCVIWMNGYPARYGPLFEVTRAVGSVDHVDELATGQVRFHRPAVAEADVDLSVCNP